MQDVSIQKRMAFMISYYLVNYCSTHPIVGRLQENVESIRADKMTFMHLDV